MDTPIDIIRTNYHALNDPEASIAAVKELNDHRELLSSIDDLKNYTKVLRHIILDQDLESLTEIFGTKEYLFDLLDYVIIRINNLEQSFNKNADFKLEIHLYVDSLKLFQKSISLNPDQLAHDSKIRLVIENALITKQKIKKLSNPSEQLVEEFHLTDEILSLAELIEDNFFSKCSGKLYEYLNRRYLDFVLYQQKILREFPLFIIDAHYVRGNRDGMKFLNFALKRSMSVANRLSHSIDNIVIPKNAHRVQFGEIVGQKTHLTIYALSAHINYLTIVGVLKTLNIDLETISMIDNKPDIAILHQELQTNLNLTPALKSTGGMADTNVFLMKVIKVLETAIDKYSQEVSPENEIIDDLKSRLAIVQNIKASFNPVGKNTKSKKKKR